MEWGNGLLEYPFCVDTTHHVHPCKGSQRFIAQNASKSKLIQLSLPYLKGVPFRAEITPIEPGQVMLPRDIFYKQQNNSPFYS